jgi:3-oxoacyl-[acyl-carrier-protein] synthase II
MTLRAAITSMGICSALGHDPERVLEAIRQGRSGIGPIRAFDASTFQMKLAAEIQDFDPYQHFSRAEVLEVDRATQLAYVAAVQAIRNSGVSLQDLPPHRVGLAVGMSGAGQYQNLRLTLQREPPLNEAAGFYVMRGVPHFQAEFLAEKLGIHGPHVAIATASAGSAIAIGYALDLLRSGKVDLVLAGGGESFTLLNALGMDSLALSSDRPCSPFSGTPGITFGEGAAFLVLEPLEQARQRNAAVLAELLGYGTTIDGYDGIANDPCGEGVYGALAAALRRSGLAKEEIDWVRASGTGNRDQDQAETLALKQLFGQKAPPVSSLEPYFGHANGASPAFGLVAAIACQRDGLIPPTLNFGAPRPGCDLDYVPNQPRTGKVRYFLANSMAFGGVNTVLAVGQLQPDRTPPAPRADDLVITGLGIVSALGFTPEAFVEGLRQRRSGVGELDRFGTQDCRCKRAALVRGFDAHQLVPALDLRRVDRIVEYAVVAGALALRDAGLERGFLGRRVGLVTSMARGPVVSSERYYESIRKNPRTPAAGRLLLRMGRFSVTSHMAHALGLKGVGVTISEGVTAGLHALAHAAEMFRQNDTQDALLVVAADEIGPYLYRLFAHLGTLAAPDSPHGEAPAPYDPRAGGMVLGEGAAALVLERQSTVCARRGRVQARLAGWALTADASGYGEMEPEGRWLERAMRLALAEAKLAPADVDVAYGHGRGLPEHDGREVRALGRLLAGRATPVGCVLGNTGVAESASGLFSVAAAVLGLQRGEAFPVATAGQLPGQVAFVQGGPRCGDYRRALVAGSTEHGNNAAVVLTQAAA